MGNEHSNKRNNNVTNNNNLEDDNFDLIQQGCTRFTTEEVKLLKDSNKKV